MTELSRQRPVRRFGDGALVAEVESVSDAQRLAAAVSGTPGWQAVTDVVVGYRSVTVLFDPDAADVGAMALELARIPGAFADSREPRRVEIPVAFDGPDLDEVAQRARLAPSDVVGQLAGAELRVAFLGFLPGFAYLDGLPPSLASVARRATPRTAVAAGSVGIGGGFAGIYPQASPGGWQLLGRTGFPLFDPDTPPFSALQPGDVVHLRAVEDPGVAPARSRPPLRSVASGTVVVEDPGLLSMVQDLGRFGVARWGVPAAGAADPFALRVANRLVGNHDGAGALEVTARGPRLRFDGPAHVAVVGGRRGQGPVPVTVDGRPVEPDTVFPVAPGQVLRIGETVGDLRCYLAVSGGLEVAPVFGSRSSDVLTGLGPGALRTGDVLGIGTPNQPRGHVVEAAAGPGGRVLRVIPGPDELGARVFERLTTSTWEVGTSSDRMGVRLRSEEPLEVPAPGIASRGMVTGAVQVPPDGGPVALLCDHATVGGYPVVATVVSADLGILGRCRPGDDVRFEPVDFAEAQRARAELRRRVERAVVGWYPVRSD